MELNCDLVMLDLARYPNSDLLKNGFKSQNLRLLGQSFLSCSLGHSLLPVISQKLEQSGLEVPGPELTGVTLMFMAYFA